MAERSFGAELRRRREAAGLSLRQLADRVHYSVGHLSRVESSDKTPSLSLIRLCDAALDAHGSLVALAEQPADPRPQPAVSGGDRWSMSMSMTGDTELVVYPHDGLGAIPQLMAGWSRPDRNSTVPGGEQVVTGFDSIFRELRRLGQTVPPVTLLPVLVAHNHALRMLVGTVPARYRDRTLLLAARFAEYTGWMSQEAGDDRAAMWWTDGAASLAASANDRDLGPYALVRRALISMYQGDAVSTVELARQAQAADCSSRVRGLAAQREAQGLALGGDYSGCMRALDRAADLLGSRGDQEQIIGPWTVRDPIALAKGWSLCDLGRPDEAAAALEPEFALIPAHAVRARTRYGARLALSWAGASKVEEACVVAGTVLDAMPVVDSATIRRDVRDLRRALGRWHTHRAVRDLMPRLNGSLAVRGGWSKRT